MSTQLGLGSFESIFYLDPFIYMQSRPARTNTAAGGWLPGLKVSINDDDDDDIQASGLRFDTCAIRQEDANIESSQVWDTSCLLN